jgi:hypothetical protein
LSFKIWFPSLLILFQNKMIFLMVNLVYWNLIKNYKKSLSMTENKLKSICPGLRDCCYQVTLFSCSTLRWSFHQGACRLKATPYLFISRNIIL